MFDLLKQYFLENQCFYIHWFFKSELINLFIEKYIFLNQVYNLFNEYIVRISTEALVHQFYITSKSLIPNFNICSYHIPNYCYLILFERFSIHFWNHLQILTLQTNSDPNTIFSNFQLHPSILIQIVPFSTVFTLCTHFKNNLLISSLLLQVNYYTYMSKFRSIPYQINRVHKVHFLFEFQKISSAFILSTISDLHSKFKIHMTNPRSIWPIQCFTVLVPFGAFSFLCPSSPYKLLPHQYLGFFEL